MTLKYEIGSMKHWAAIGPPIAEAIKDSFSEVEETARLYPIGGNFNMLRYENEFFKATEGVYTDSTFFEVFTFPLKHGNPVTALIEPGNVVISEEMARALFGDENPIGKDIHMGEAGVIG